jgi:alpha-glucosidase
MDARQHGDSTWWKEGVIYQIYPRSFADANGDGVGDLRGIIAHLDYLNDGSADSLGVDGILLSPIYPSPLYDFGYDVSDYHDVDPAFGTLADFDLLVAEAHRRGLRIILDLVMNHTSHRHPWFLESRSSRDNPKRHWYIWRDRPNNWRSVFGGSAWEWDQATRQYYLHSFLAQQPDLNWRNPEVQEALMAEVRFWLDRGVDGFRLDVANFFFKDDQFRDNPFHLGGLRGYDRQRHVYDKDRPETHRALKAFRQILDGYPERMSVGEIGTHDPVTAASYLGDGQDELHLAFNFAFTHCGWDARAFHRAIAAWERALPAGGWPCYVLSNHDVTRHYSRYAHGGQGDARAKVAAAMLLTLRGTPFLYYGEEIGMRNVHIPRREIQDPPGKRYWPFYRGRDGCRTPMQWDPGQGAGFGAGVPWLRLGPDYPRVNVATQSRDPNSLLSFYRKLIRCRKASPALRRGSYRALIEKPVDSLVYLREAPEQSVLVCLNFSSRPTRVDLGAASLPAEEWRVLLASAGRTEERVIEFPNSKSGIRALLPLDPYEALILEAV